MCGKSGKHLEKLNFPKPEKKKKKLRSIEEVRL
jgi:hypothetical protein